MKDVVIVPPKKMINKFEIFFTMVWLAIFAAAYFYADRLVGVYRSSEEQGLVFAQPIFNQETLLSYWPIVISLITLEVVLLFYKWRVGQWTMYLFWVSTAIHLFNSLAILFIASNPDLLNSGLASYLSDIMELSTQSVNNSLNVIWAIIIISIIATFVIETWDSYRKAKIPLENKR